MEQLCRSINMPEEVTQQMVSLHEIMEMHSFLPLLMKRETWKTGLEQMKEALGDDPLGMKELCSMLRCAIMARDTYAVLGISNDIYIDTMAAFSRFVREHMESYGFYGFHRANWTTRQVSGTLFRIGQLEYELTTLKDIPMVSLHIPTDVDLRSEVLRPSVKEALKKLYEIFPDYADKTVFCHTWLLSAQLKDMLPETSNILLFQEMFDIEPEGYPGNDILTWVFKNPDLPKEEYPENTSLQRKLKTFLLEGKQFCNGRGYLRDI